ncbi:hypothetical protein F4804DRAFT_276663 [Jackrogersella minutella]|nr:hypothetical protein F4804DRAFT_276663 [Jackrogersella minutella]
MLNSFHIQCIISTWTIYYPLLVFLLPLPLCPPHSHFERQNQVTQVYTYFFSLCLYFQFVMFIFLITSRFLHYCDAWLVLSQVLSPHFSFLSLHLSHPNSKRYNYLSCLCVHYIHTHTSASALPAKPGPLGPWTRPVPFCRSFHCTLTRIYGFPHFVVTQTSSDRAQTQTS